MANGARFSFITHPPRWHFKRVAAMAATAAGYHGDNRGQYYFEHEVWDLSDPVVLREASTSATI